MGRYDTGAEVKHQKLAATDVTTISKATTRYKLQRCTLITKHEDVIIFRQKKNLFVSLMVPSRSSER